MTQRMKEVIVALKDSLPYVAISGTNLQPAFPESDGELWPFYLNRSRRQMLVWVAWNLSDYCQEPDERHALDVLGADAQEQIERTLTNAEWRLLADCVRDHYVVKHALDEDREDRRDTSERARKAEQLRDTQARLYDPFFNLRSA